MKYEINRLRILNQETPTPCKQYMDIAINVVPVKDNDSLFVILDYSNLPQYNNRFGD